MIKKKRRPVWSTLVLVSRFPFKRNSLLKSPANLFKETNVGIETNAAANESMDKVLYRP